MASTRSLPDEIARAVSGTVREVPTAPGHVASYAIALADGRVPVLVRHFQHGIGISVAGARAWHERRSSARLVAEVVAATRTWSSSSGPGTATILEVALDLAATLSEAYAERWFVSIPGTPEPREMGLHGTDPDAASVGIFEGRIVVRVDGALRELAVESRADLPHRRAPVVAAVRAQRACHERNRIVSDRIRARAAELARALGAHLGRPCTSTISGRPSHAGAISALVCCAVGPEARGLVELSARGGTIHAHAGVVGSDGWDGTLEDLDVALPAILPAALRALSALTIEGLAPGVSYRVKESVQELRAGAVVRFRGFEDIDNHYGRYEFVTTSGDIVAVAGDFSNPRTSPLAETHRYLEPLPPE